MQNILGRIIECKRRDIEESKRVLPLDKIIKSLPGCEAKRNFCLAISAPGRINLIAELKKASPSKGILRSDFKPEEIARIFEANGAGALSVLTEKNFFQGDLSYIKRVKEVTMLPVLRKDFIIDLYQLYESAYFGADAVLLIAGILSDKELKDFADTARGLNLEVMFEAHREEDLNKILCLSSARIVGINNRNLSDFKVDLATTARLKTLIPPEKIIVAESGINSSEAVSYLSGIGVNAVLAGEVFMTAEDIGAKVKEVMGY